MNAYEQMREALEELTDKVLDYLHKGLIQLPLPLENATAKARAALSAPARNCDCYDNEDDVESAYREFSQREVDKVPLDTLDYSKETRKIPGKIKWLLAPAAEREGATA